MEKIEISNLEKLEYVLPLIQKIIPNDVSIGLTNREKYLQYLPGKKFDLKIKVGEPIKPESSVNKAMIEGKKIHIRIDKTVYGQAYVVSAIPIYDDGNNVIGAVAISTSVEIQDMVMEMSSELSNSIGIISSTTQKISAQAQGVAAVCNELGRISQDSGTRVLKTNNILDVIKNISTQVNMLGLNAAIEAARAGEKGRGFSVVAKEIRKLAENSYQSIKQISEIVTAIQADSEYNQNELNNISDMTLQIAEAVTNISEILTITETMASKLERIAEGLKI